ncbi:peptide chain release factor 1 [Candidatus Bipolaricaulota bacterium]|nr:peptide chain release factor 1 [Candidatus Bipolaricaulota bacterium]
MLDILAELPKIQEEYKELEKKMGDPEVIESNRYQTISQQYAKVKEILTRAEELKEVKLRIEENEEMLEAEDDEEMIELIEEELSENRNRRQELQEEVKDLLIPESEEDKKNAILEIRAGAGGDESALFAADLLRLYSRYADKQDFQVETLENRPTSIGGFTLVSIAIEGKGAYGKYKYESGVHRVQRVPETESSGRIHTSTATVAVLPEAEEVDVEIDRNEVRVDTFRSSGPGGQHANVTDSAVRLTHEPTDIVVTCQDESSQHKNRKKAWRVLRSRYKEKIEEAQAEKRDSKRRGQIGQGQRSEKIRTYNFPQNRVTDHRINYTTHNLEGILEGELDELFEELIAAEEEKRLENFEIEDLLDT